MRVRSVLNIANDSQYNFVKDDMNKNSFDTFVKDLVDDYAEFDFPQIYIYLDWLDKSDKIQFLKQYMFFEGYTEWWEEIHENPAMVDAVLEEHYKVLENILQEAAEDKEQDLREAYAEEYNLRAERRPDNGELYYTRR